MQPFYLLLMLGLGTQLLPHPWLSSESHPIPLDILVYKLVKSYLHASPFKRAALKALSKALTEDELVYFRAQFMLLEPNKDGHVSLDNFRMALLHNATDAMKESRVPDILNAVDLDLGNYEQFLDVKLAHDNNITTGKIYQLVIDKERKGDYLGKTVQVVPHITDAIQDWIERVAAIPVDGKEGPPDVCVIELGGIIGDIESMPFIEALGQFSYRVAKSSASSLSGFSKETDGSCFNFFTAHLFWKLLLNTCQPCTCSKCCW